MMKIPSPAIAFVGRHNSGKTTLVEKLIAELVSRGVDVGSIKHHSHKGFEIDYPGKDSYRHRAAGASETVISAPGQIARIATVEEEMECWDIVRSMPGHDIVVVEGYRKSGLPTIEVMRAANPADMRVARVFVEGARVGLPLGSDFTQISRAMYTEAAGDEVSDEQIKEAVAAALADAKAQGYVVPGVEFDPQMDGDLVAKLPTAGTAAVATDIPEVAEAAASYGIPAFPLDDVNPLADFMIQRCVRPRITVVIQAGGESRRMGQSKATVPFAGRALICRLIERVSPVADELLITTNEADRLAFLHDMYPELNIRFVKDEYNYRGALPGLYSALNAASFPHVAVVACDMVFASAALIVAESLEMHKTGSDVVVPVNKHGYEPFHAMYRKDACLPAVLEALGRGEKRAQSFFAAVNVEEFPQAKVLEAEPMGGCFINCNTPDELHYLEDSFIE